MVLLASLCSRRYIYFVWLKTTYSYSNRSICHTRSNREGKKPFRPWWVALLRKYVQYQPAAVFQFPQRVCFQRRDIPPRYLRIYDLPISISIGWLMSRIARPWHRPPFHHLCSRGGIRESRPFLRIQKWSPGFFRFRWDIWIPKTKNLVRESKSIPVSLEPPLPAAGRAAVAKLQPKYIRKNTSCTCCPELQLSPRGCVGSCDVCLRHIFASKFKCSGYRTMCPAMEHSIQIIFETKYGRQPPFP